MKIAILIILLAFCIFTAIKYYISSLILSAWIAEKNYAPPEKEDMDRLAKWVVQKLFGKTKQ